MKQGFFEIKTNNPIALNVYEMVLSGEDSAITSPGQFVNIKLNEEYLRRPISVCDYDEKNITIIYKVVGHGTEIMSKMKPGESLDLLLGLGNGFSTEESGETPVLIGGGVGVPPMFNLAKKLIQEGKKISVILGFNKRMKSFMLTNLKRLVQRFTLLLPMAR